MELLELLTLALEKKASDLHISVAVPPVIRVNGKLRRLDMPSFSPRDTENMVNQLLTEKQKNDLEAKGELDFSFSNPGPVQPPSL